MRRLLGFLLLTALVVAGTVWLADRPGEVTIRWMGWRIDTTVPVLAAVLVALTVVLGWLVRGLRLVLGAPGRLRARGRERRTRKGYQALSDGLAAAAAGDSRQAARLARQADRLLDAAPVTGLLAVQAARLTGDADEARKRCVALTERDETAFVGFHGLMELALKDGDKAAALNAAGRAFALRPGADGLAVALFQLQMAADLPAEAEHTLALAKRHGALAGADLDGRRALALYARAVAAEQAGDAAHALTLALEARDRDPALVPAVALAARLEQRRGKPRKAAALILAAFGANPHPDLAAVWATLGGEGETPLDRVKRMERLVAANPAAADGHLALAEAALAARLWGQARTHLEMAQDRRPGRRALALLARLEHDERHDQAAAGAWMAKAGQMPADPAWVCGACGQAAARFAARCPACDAVGTMEWRP